LKQWRFFPFEQLDAFENMAIDEAIFRFNQFNEVPPTLRFYGWKSPAVSLGYFQDVEEEVDVETCRRMNIPIVRRPTGGKAVLHEGDVTYAVVARDSNPLFTVDILGTYRVISRCIANGLALLGIEASMADNSRAPDGDFLKASCFSSPSRYELLVENRKICGSAQVRSHGVFLQHGSILMDFNPVKTCDVMLPRSGDYERQAFRMKQSVTSVIEHTDSGMDISTVCRMLKAGFEKTLGIELVRGILCREEEEFRTLLMTHKYMNESWNMKGGCRAWI
jgi:lipoate-protein ligase A